MLLWVELALLLLCIVIGARIGGIGLGTISGIGLVIYVFVFRMPPGGPPGTVLGFRVNDWTDMKTGAGWGAGVGVGSATGAAGSATVTLKSRVVVPPWVPVSCWVQLKVPAVVGVPPTRTFGPVAASWIRVMPGGSAPAVTDQL